MANGVRIKKEEKKEIVNLVKDKKKLYIIIGIICVVLLVCGGCIVSNKSFNNKSTKTSEKKKSKSKKKHTSGEEYKIEEISLDDTIQNLFNLLGGYEESEELVKILYTNKAFQAYKFSNLNNEEDIRIRNLIDHIGVEDTVEGTIKYWAKEKVQKIWYCISNFLRW